MRCNPVRCRLRTVPLSALLSKFERTSCMPLVNRSNLVAGEFQNIAYRFSTVCPWSGGATTLWTSCFILRGQVGPPDEGGRTVLAFFALGERLSRTLEQSFVAK